MTLGSVGSGTKIDHVQVSYSNDDSFEWFGGTVNCKYLVAYKGWDDDFDTDNGFSGKVQFGLSVRDPRIADQSQSNGFESDNCADGAQVSPYTTATFSNITFVGPKTAADFQNSNSYITAGSYFPNNGSGLGKFQAAMQIRRSSRLNCVNSVVTDWPIGLIIDGEKGDTPAQAKAGTLRLQNIFIANADILGSDANKCYEDKEYDYKAKAVKADSKQSYSHTFFETAANNNRYFADKSALMLTDGKGVGVAFMPQTGSNLFGAQNFSGLDSWFDQVTYIGAFNANDNWLDGWTNFDPQNAQY